MKFEHRMHFRSQSPPRSSTQSFLLIFIAFIVFVVFLFSSVMLLGTADSRPVDVKSDHRPATISNVAATSNTASVAPVGTVTHFDISSNPIKVAFVIFPSMLGPGLLLCRARIGRRPPNVCLLISFVPCFQRRSR